MAFTIRAMFFIDKIGRKPLLLTGAIGMCLSLAGAAIHYYDGALVGNGGMVLSVLSFVACFARSRL